MKAPPVYKAVNLLITQGFAQKNSGKYDDYVNKILPKTILTLFYLFVKMPKPFCIFLKNFADAYSILPPAYDIIYSTYL